MKRIFLCLSALCFCIWMTGCGKGEPTGNTEEEAQIWADGKVHGHSANMRFGGLTDGNEDGFYYSFQGMLYYQPQGQPVQTVDENGGRFLCLAGNILYYVSEDENGVTGIYALSGDEHQRRLICETDARYLYEYNGYLYFTNYPSGADICRLYIGNQSESSEKSKKTGNSENNEEIRAETILSGSYDSLIVTEEALFYRDMTTGQYFRQGLSEDGTLSDASEWLAYADDTMPITDGTGEWLYYELEDASWHYKIGLQDQTAMGRYAKAGRDYLLWEGILYENGYADDLSGGEKTRWTEDAYITLIGVAGGRLLYQSEVYTEEELMLPHPSPESISLYAYTLSTGDNTLLMKKDREDLTPQQAQAAYDRLLTGDLTLLREQEPLFARTMIFSDEPESYDLDMTGEGIPERFLRIGKNSMILHARYEGICLYLLDTDQDTEWYEPLEDGSILYRYLYEGEGYGADVYDIYKLTPGGGMMRSESYQHLTADLTSISGYDPETDALVKTDRYYVNEDFAGQSDWQKGVDIIADKQLTK